MNIWPWSKLREQDQSLTRLTRDNALLTRRLDWHVVEYKRLMSETARKEQDHADALEAANAKNADLHAYFAKELRKYQLTIKELHVDRSELVRRIGVLEQKREPKET